MPLSEPAPSEGVVPSPRERFNPVPLPLLVEALEPLVGDPAFTALAEGFVLLYDAHFSRELERLKALYLPWHPEGGRPRGDLSKALEKKRWLLEAVEALLLRANFLPLDRRAIEEALNKTSPYGVEVSVDLSQFSEIALYYRGDRLKTLPLPWWRELLGEREPIKIPVYQRLFVVLQLKPETGEAWTPLYFKLFRDIPHSDLETLFPNVKVKLRPIDKLKLAATAGTGALGGIVSATGKLAAATSPATALSALGTIGAALWKVVANILQQRTQYLARLAQNLYLYNLDNDVGALAWLVEAASSEEVKEALLAYAFLLKEGPLSREALDCRIERFLKEQFGVEVDYEVEDGLRKLRELELLRERRDGALEVVDSKTASRKLLERWQRLFPIS